MSGDIFGLYARFGGPAAPHLAVVSKDGNDGVISSFWTRRTACMSCVRSACATHFGNASVQVLGVLFVRSLRGPGCSEILAVKTLYY